MADALTEPMAAGASASTPGATETAAALRWTACSPNPSPRPNPSPNPNPSPSPSPSPSPILTLSRAVRAYWKATEAQEAQEAEAEGRMEATMELEPCT